MTITFLMPNPKQQYFLAAGIPLVGGKVYTFAAGTNTPKQTFTDAAGTVPQTNPIILNARGEPASAIFWQGNYKVEIRDALNNLIYTVDNYNSDPAGTANILANYAAPGGSNLIGFLQAGLGAIPRTMQDKAREIVSVADFGATGDGITDVTANFMQAMAIGNTVKVNAGIYIINSIAVTRSVTIECEGNVIFRRKAGVDLASGGFNTSNGMFTIQTNGITLNIVGSPTFDGNRANQTTVEPSGFSVMVKLPAPIVAGSDIKVFLDRPNFINGTSGYISLRGDDVNRRYRVQVELQSPRFSDTAAGKGKGDPSTPNPLGYNPTYIFCYDYVTLITYNLYAEYTAPTTTGIYAPCVVFGTFTGAQGTGGQPLVYMFGTTETVNLGRSSKKWDDDNNYIFNNGLGVIDLYGDCEELFVENVRGLNNKNTTVRAKASLKFYTVLSATLTNCFRGLQVGPSTTGFAETIVNVGSFTSRGGTIPQLEFTGTTITDYILSVTIESVSCYDTYTNPEGLANGIVRIANVAKFCGQSMALIGAPYYAINCSDVDRATLSNIVVNSSGNEGVFVTGGTFFSIENFDIRNCALGPGIHIGNSIPETRIENGRIDTVVNFGIYNQSTTGIARITNVSVNNVSGQNRGFYNQGGNVVMIGNYTTAATPLLLDNSVILSEKYNSWNSREIWGNFTSTTVGTWKVGDVVWNNAPAPSGNIGWVCTTAGSPGTFKSWGTIAP